MSLLLLGMMSRWVDGWILGGTDSVVWLTATRRAWMCAGRVLVSIKTLSHHSNLTYNEHISIISKIPP